ncbi:retron St85 family effector protein [Burkholderia gladioli]|uniref:retron St85 family effector protein n=1 Tax=Burkholderia gladioli TaxID=28095 RepID=UPI00163FCDB6|nr:retron St85 family effector protein [Burkholderia gladioli]
MLSDPRPSVLSNVDIMGSRVEFCDSPIVLLCGGPVAQKERANDPDPDIKSLRDAITRSHDADYEIFRPEEITSWQADGVFQNLMDFESDLGSICSLVVVILESAGSLVELGAFSQLDEFREKMIAITSTEFGDADSFINLGILRFIRAIDNSRVKSYPWLIGGAKDIDGDVVGDVVSDVRAELDKLEKSQTFRLNSRSHVIVLICEIIKLFSALKEGEILEYVAGLGVSLTKKELRSRLFLLERFRLIRKITYSDSQFYVRTGEAYHKLRFSLKKSHTQDYLRIKTQCLEYYAEDPKQKHRLRAISQASGAGART